MSQPMTTSLVNWECYSFFFTSTFIFGRFFWLLFCMVLSAIWYCMLCVKMSYQSQVDFNVLFRTVLRTSFKYWTLISLLFSLWRCHTVCSIAKETWIFHFIFTLNLQLFTVSLLLFLLPQWRKKKLIPSLFFLIRTQTTRKKIKLFS